VPEALKMRAVKLKYCFSHLLGDEFIEHLLAEGSYLVNSLWLKNWKKNLASLGFDHATAAYFFQETLRQLVFLDAGLDKGSELLLREFAAFVGLPYLIIPLELKNLELMLKSIVYEWRLQVQAENNSSQINEFNARCAEYAAVLDFLGKISSYTSKRNIISKIEELFMLVFGAQSFKFWPAEAEDLPLKIKEFKEEKEKSFVLWKEQNRFCIKVEGADTLYGILDVSAFLFPQYIERYLNLAVEVSKVCGLVLHDHEQYVKVLESERKLKYLSQHDPLTGLYNRTYLNQLLENDLQSKSRPLVFMFDIDCLKQVNDNYGHSEGDKLIFNFARILKESFREDDLLIRIGGDEFTAILPFTGPEEVKAIVKRIEDNLKNYNRKPKAPHLKLSVSMGYAVLEKEKDSLEDVLQRADAAMYENKRSKKEKTTDLSLLS